MQDFDIIDYGACPEKEHINTEAIQNAIDACNRGGGGRVFCGPGTWITGSLELKSNVELFLSAGCKLLGSEDMDDYEELVADGFDHKRAPEKSAQALIRAVDAENIAITGPGITDGAGLAFYENVDKPGKLRKPPTPRPRILMFYRCRGVRIIDTAFRDSPCWTIWLMMCRDVGMHRITITGNPRMRNVDGIDIDGCKDVNVSDCRIRTEDDCIVLRAIQKLYDEPAVCENVTVTGCTLESRCQAIRVGCPNDNTVRNCVLSNIVINNSKRGINFNNPNRYYSADAGQTADVHDILFDNIRMDCYGTPLAITVEDGIKLRRLSDISFSNMRITGTQPCEIIGCNETIPRNIRFSNVKFEISDEEPLRCRRCTGIKLDNVEFEYRENDEMQEIL